MPARRGRARATGRAGDCAGGLALRYPRSVTAAPNDGQVTNGRGAWPGNDEGGHRPPSSLRVARGGQNTVVVVLEQVLVPVVQTLCVQVPAPLALIASV